MSAAKFIWTDPHGRGRNVWSLFRREFDLGADPVAAVISLFADTRYRLIVNGHTVGHGPARFFPGQPEADAWDVTHLLRSGTNCLAVVVNSGGPATFHSADSVGGLFACLTVGLTNGTGVEIGTNESWSALVSPAHDPATGRLSFALGWAEAWDLRQWPTGWDQPGFADSGWPAAVVHGYPEHWGPLRARSIPPLDESPVLPVGEPRRWSAQPRAEECVYRVMLPVDPWPTPSRRVVAAVFTRIWSPTEQDVVTGAWWGRHFLNGQPIAPVKRPDWPWRQDLPVHLQAGWNTFERVEPTYTPWQDWWEFELCLPADARLRLEAADGRPEVAFLVGGPWDAAAVDLEAWPLGQPGGDWTPWLAGTPVSLPHRDRARLELHPPMDADHPQNQTGAWLYDFGTEVLGRAVLDIEAPAGTVFTLGYTERLADDGTASLAFRHFQDMVDQVIWPGGRHRWQAMHPRGGRWLEVCALSNADEVVVHGVSMTRATYPGEQTGSFECSDPLLNRIWELGRETLVACREDAYLDCPGRERGLYSGDFLVQYLVDQATYGDTALFRRCIDLFLQTQGDGGVVAGGCFGLPPGRHSDYSAIIVSCLWQDYVWTGDASFVATKRDALTRLLDGLSAMLDADHGLIDATGGDPYIDLQAMDKGGVSCALNCFFAKAFADGAALYRVLGEAALAEAWQTRADTLAGHIRAAFWNEERGCFLDRRLCDVPDTQPSVAANALPVVFGLATDEQAQRAHAWLCGALADPFLVPEPRHNRETRVTSYFAYYALGALYEHANGDRAALDLMRLGWGRMLEAGAWTCWEYLVDEDGASRCHAWSASPTYYLSAKVLGIEFPEPGNLDRIVVRPRPSGLTWARGTWPHPRGVIEVSWVDDDGLRLQVSAPPGVVVES